MLASNTNETAHLAVREGKYALFIDHVTTNHIIAVSGLTGELVPLYCPAHGKALIADHQKTELQSLFGTAGLKAHTENTITNVNQLARACAEIKAQDYATDDSEFQEGIRCVAAPIRDNDGAIIASIGISVPIARFPKERFSEFADNVRKIAKQISDVFRLQAQEAS
jgi:IclR family acetate operon transcriptional repressor